MLKMSSSGTNTRMETFASLIYCVIDHALLQATPDIDHTLLQLLAPVQRVSVSTHPAPKHDHDKISAFKFHKVV